MKLIREIINTFGKDFNQYIKSAGGYTKTARQRLLLVPNGRTKKMGLLSFSPKIIDGCEIFVGKKEDVDPLVLLNMLLMLLKFMLI